jgi:hypothetical protein
MTCTLCNAMSASRNVTSSVATLDGKRRGVDFHRLSGTSIRGAQMTAP